MPSLTGINPYTVTGFRYFLVEKRRQRLFILNYLFFLLPTQIGGKERLGYPSDVVSINP